MIPQRLRHLAQLRCVRDRVDREYGEPGLAAEVPGRHVRAAGERNVARRLEWLRPDVEPEDEKILTSLTQFDFLADLVAMADSDNKSGIFPDFARFYAEPTQPAAQRLLREPEMRKIIYPGDDHHLAEALHTIDREAQRAGFRYDGWDGYTRDVNAFIREHGVGTDQP